MKIITRIIRSLIAVGFASSVISTLTHAYPTTIYISDGFYSDDGYCDDDSCTCSERKDYDSYVEYYDDSYPTYSRYGCYTTYGYPEDFGYPEYVDYYPPYYRHYPYYIGHRYGPFFGIGLGF